MSKTSATVRIRPLRFGFLLDPSDPVVLRDVLQINSCLWGGIYNYFLPVPDRAPARYRDYMFAGSESLKLKFMKGTGPSAQQLVEGLLEAFQPDLLVETKPGLASKVPFDQSRIVSLDQFNQVEDRGSRKYGIDLRSICMSLYKETFRFVQRHPPNVIQPRCADKRYKLLFAAVFGEFPTHGDLAGCQRDFLAALDGKDKEIEAHRFHELFAPGNLYPLRVGAYELTTHRRGWTPGPVLFYMDERKPYDIIEFWNLRALGWPIWPLPQSLAPQLTDYCEKFIVDAHRPLPPPSNASRDASFLCSRSCAFDEMQAYVATLKRPSTYLVSIDPRMPRLWEEWGSRADHTEPQVVEYRTDTTSVLLTGNSLSISTLLPEFLAEYRFRAPSYACTNVVETIPGGAVVVPWQMIDIGFLSYRLLDDLNVWVGREGVCIGSGAYQTYRHLRLPSSFNVFSAWARKSSLDLEISPAGRVAKQVISALGGLDGVRIIGSQELIDLLDRMASGFLEEEDQAKDNKRRQHKSSIPLYTIKEVLKRAHDNNPDIANNFLSALLECNVLILGMEVQCSKCDETTWFALDRLRTKLTCGRCLRQFGFPVTKPHRNTWSYRVQGPFAVGGYAQGAYCVAMALQFLASEVSRECTWIPSFRLRRKAEKLVDAEADFGLFLKPGIFSQLTAPMLIFGECKTFSEFEARDYIRMGTLATLFPGSIICFCTLRSELTKREKKRIAALARRGRKSLRTGQQRNPVLVLTGTELIGQFDLQPFTAKYPSQFATIGESVFRSHDLQEICNLSQQIHLGIESYHEWVLASERKRSRKLISSD